MLSVVVDDHDMGITHIIRGDDHLTNTFRQIQIYRACNWQIPNFGHIPLIYGPDGAKLSKRHGAASADDYYNLGYLPEALINYLLRLGWSHGDDEIISRKQAIEWFNLENMGKSPSRFDVAKLQNLNAHYIRQKESQALMSYMEPFLGESLDSVQSSRILRGMDGLKERAKTIVDLADASKIYISSPATYDQACEKYATTKHMQLLMKVLAVLKEESSHDSDSLQQAVREIAAEAGTKLVEIAQALRGALCGMLVSPSVFEIIVTLGNEEAISRIERYISYFQQSQ
jgi:glutamyl-tRNA synthetase